MYDEFTKRDTVVIAVSQEDKAWESAKLILKHFKKSPPFDIVADVNKEKTPRYERTTIYYIDKQGIVRQIFPMLIHMRPNWESILHEIDRLQSHEPT